LRKLWFRRRAVSTMIGGIIVLAIFLVALMAMVLVSQQYDIYQTTAKQMSQKDIDRFSEDLIAVYPGISWPPTQGVQCNTPTGTTTCDQFTITIDNLAGIATQIARIYINSTSECNGLCIFDPATEATNSTFNFNDRLVNPSEYNHYVTMWLQSGKLTNGLLHSIMIATTRGRVFSFVWPMQATTGISQPGGSLYLGCLAINFDKLLVTYTGGAHATAVPLASAWLFPGGVPVIFWVRVSNICPNPVELLDKSTFYVMQYTGAGTGASNAFYVANPMAPSQCYTVTPNGPGYYCISTTSNGNVAPMSNDVYGYNASLQACSPQNPCYILPQAPEGEQSPSSYILFSSGAPCFSGPSVCKNGKTAANSIQGNLGGTYVVFLAMYWKCLTPNPPPSGEPTLSCAAGYEFGVTLPFITIQTCDPTGQSKTAPACT
jgi:hypothetical protein